jgi:hypothetical protein
VVRKESYQLGRAHGIGVLGYLILLSTPGATEDELDTWIQAISDLRDSVMMDPADETAAQGSVANLWSGFGYTDAPAPVLQMLINAIEAGYATALRDMREGRLDDEVRARLLALPDD